MKKFWAITALSILFFFSIQISVAQTKFRGFWQMTEEFDDNAQLNIGMIFPSFTYLNYSITKERGWNDKVPIDIKNKDSIILNSIFPSPGFQIGFGVKAGYNITSNIQLNLAIKFDLNSSKLGLKFNGLESDSLGIIKEKTYEYDMYHFIDKNVPAIIEFPFTTYIKSTPRKLYNKSKYETYRLYLLGGVKYGRFFNGFNEEDTYKVTSPIHHKEREPTIVFNPHQFSWETGSGIQLTFRYMRLSTEISYNQSFGNLLDKNQYKKVKDYMANKSTDYANPLMDGIKSLGIRGWQIKLIFE